MPRTLADMQTSYTNTHAANTAVFLICKNTRLGKGEKVDMGLHPKTHKHTHI